MNISFEPLTPDARIFLAAATGINFDAANFADESTWFCCTVTRPDDRIALVIVFEFKSPFDAHFTLAVADPKGLSRRLITLLYRTVFRRAARVTALIDPTNRDALKGVGRMGFQYEGLLRRGYDGKLDAVVWGLLPEDCPYLRGRPFRQPPRTVFPLSAAAAGVH